MQEVTVKYNGGKSPMVFDLKLPGTWDELSESNILYIGKYWQSWQMMIINELDMTKARAMLFLELTGIQGRSKLRNLCEALSHMNEDTHVNVLCATNFVLEKRDLTKNLIPVIRISPYEKYCGPADRLADISIDEFSFAFACYSAWHKTSEEKWLDNLAGVLYRPANKNFDKDGKKKIPFNNNLIEKYAASFAKLPDGYKNFIFLFFSGCLDKLVKKFPEVFNSDNKAKSNGSFQDTVVELSGQEFGDWEKTKATDLHVVLRALQRKIIASKEREAK